MTLRGIWRCFILILGLWGCAPEVSSTSVSPSAPLVLSERPSQQAEILSRHLLYQNDPRISYCEILNSQSDSYSGLRDTNLEPLASLSKVITSVWSLEKLGPSFRFQSEIFLKQVDTTGLYDVYLKTNFDPVVNIEKLLYLISEMNRTGVRQIRNLVIDESTRIFLGVLSNPHIELKNTPVSTDETIDNLQLIFNSKNWSEKTKTAKANLLEWVQKKGHRLSLPEQFSVGSISFRSSQDINLAHYTLKLVVNSAPLFHYLKNVNVNSNNYIADALFNYLGGTFAFKQFQKSFFSLSEKEMQIFTGSGLADSSFGVRRDNLGSCFAMIKVLGFLKHQAQKAQLNLGALLLNPSLDKDGTFDSPENYMNAAVLKTGRLYEVPAMNLAGFVSTEKGMLSFVFLGHDFSSSEADQIEQSRLRMLGDIFSQFPVRSDFNSIDSSSIFF